MNRSASRWTTLGIGLATLLAGFTWLRIEGKGESLNGKSAPSRLGIPTTQLSEKEQITHLLNRLAFGRRPGLADRVRKAGIAGYIEEQLQPETIPDQETEKRLADLTTLNMNTLELLAAYPPPQLLRGIERQMGRRMGMDPGAAGSLFPELQERRRAIEERKTSPQDRQRRPRTPKERMERAMASPARVVMELSQAKLLRAIYSSRQLEEVMTDFWFNHFNVFAGKGITRWLIGSYERDAIRPHALGNFRDLLGATAQHPAMLFYLDNWLSVDPNRKYDERQIRQLYAAYLEQQGAYPERLLLEVLRRRGMDTDQIEQHIERRNRRRANRMRHPRGRGGNAGAARRPPSRRRGLNENYARELLELHTMGVDGGYTQKDIIEVARCFTGWTLLPLPMGPEFLYLDDLHAPRTKSVLGNQIENSGKRDGERVLDLLASHPSTAQFISTKLARRFVSDNPPASLVKKMAKTFLQTDGDIRAVLRTLFSSEEFWSPEAVRSKVKTPFEFVVSAARATGAEVKGMPPGLVMALRMLGQPLYGAQPPTGYKDTADAWVSTGTLLSRMKVSMALATNHLPSVEVNLRPGTLKGASFEEKVALLGEEILGQKLSPATRDALVGQLANGNRDLAARQARMIGRLAVGWILASPDFQRK